MTKEEIKSFLEKPSFSTILKNFIVQEFGENKLVTTDEEIIRYDEENEVKEYIVGVAVINGEVYYLLRNKCSDGYELDCFGRAKSIEMRHINEEIIRSYLRHFVNDKNIHIEFDFKKYKSIDEWRTDEEWFESNKTNIMLVIKGELGCFYEML